MSQEHVGVGLEDWDWRAFARFATWALLTGHWAHVRGIPLWPYARGLLLIVVLLSVLSFGVFSLVIAVTIDAALVLEETVYAVSERLVRPFVRPAPFAVRFWTAFGAEIALVLSAGWIWRTWTLGPRFIAVIMEALR